MVQPLGTTGWRFLKQTKNRDTIKPAIPLLGMYLEKNMVQKDICTLMCTAALFTIAKTWKQPKCPLAEAWVKTTKCIYTEGYYSDIKRMN